MISWLSAYTTSVVDWVITIPVDSRKPSIVVSFSATRGPTFKHTLYELLSRDMWCGDFVASYWLECSQYRPKRTENCFVLKSESFLKMLLSTVPLPCWLGKIEDNHGTYKIIWYFAHIYIADFFWRIIAMMLTFNRLMATHSHRLTLHFNKCIWRAVTISYRNNCVA